MTKRKAVRAISFLWLGSLAGAGCAFLAQVVLARVLGAEDFGLFATALATVTIMVPLAGFGVAPFWLKIFGEEGWQARRWWPGSFRFVASSTFLVLLALSLWGAVGPHETRMPVVLWLMMVYVLGQVVLELVSSKFQLEEKYLALAVWQFVPHLCRLLLVALGAWLFSQMFDVQQAALAYAFISLLVFGVGGALLLAMCRGRFALQGHGMAPAQNGEASHPRPSGLRVASEAWPFGAAGAFHLVFFQSAIILLQYLDSAESAGLYNSAFVVITAVYLFPAVIYQKFLLPKLHRWANHDHAALAESYRRGNLYMLGFGLVAFVLLIANAWWALPWVFGEEYRAAVTVLNILALAVPVRFVASSVGSVLVTRGNMRRKVRYMGAAAAASLALNVILIPVLGIIGAAVVAVLSDMLLLAMYFYAARKYVFGSRAHKFE